MLCLGVFKKKKGINSLFFDNFHSQKFHPMRNLWKLSAFLLLFACESSKFEAEVILPKIFSDGMVFQRDQSVKVWGKGEPGRKVRVSLAGATASMTIAEDSTWLLQLPRAVAGGPHILEVNQNRINDVYIGDVWLAGGQSNMEWPLKSGVIGASEEIETGGLPLIRFFKVPNSYSAILQEDVKGGEWKVADTVNMPEFSAIAWFFAKRNHLEKEVPVGIIESNWGGTPAEGWTDAEILAGLDQSYSEEAKEVLDNKEKWEEENLANEKRREMRNLLTGKPDSVTASEVSSLEYNDAAWRSINLPTSNPLQHIAWVRKKFSLQNISDVKLHLPAIDQQAYIYVNGSLIFHKDWGIEMPNELEIPEDILIKGQNVLTIRAVNTWNNQPRVGEKDEMFILQNGDKLSLEGTWKYSNDIVEPQLPKVEWYNWKPGMMYNAMIAPLTNFAIKGVIWYQGESNAGRHEEYRKLFSEMITSWRSAWDIGDFPFLFVQLANFMEPQTVQPESSWAFLREAQTQTLELPKTGMAVIIDIGEEDDIHPKNKKDVGDRLWLQARKIAFEEKEEFVSSGPVFNSFERKGNSLHLKFDQVGDGLTLKSGEAVKGFILADKSGEFQEISGEILEDVFVRIDLPEGVTAGEVRYAWADNPEVNLVNSEGLPTGPFRFSF